MAWTKPETLVALSMIAVLSACSVSGPRRPPLPNSGPTILDIYQGARNGDNAVQAQDKMPAVRSYIPLRGATEFDPGPVTMSAQAQIERRFARVPNPDMVMYVFPHLQGKHPVPGYVTMFPFYTSTEYLLPGEVAAGHAR